MYPAAPRTVSCASSLPGSVGTDSVAEPDGPLALFVEERCADEPIAVVVRDRRAATAAITRNTCLRIADLLSTLRERFESGTSFRLESYAAFFVSESWPRTRIRGELRGQRRAD